MGCACGKKKGGISVFSTEEQARIAKQRNVKVQTSAGSSNGRKTDWASVNTQAEKANAS
jgi:hypothetical protein